MANEKGLDLIILIDQDCIEATPGNLTLFCLLCVFVCCLELAGCR